ncbi:MAG: flagellar motor switch protein FliG [Rhodobacteraceae bacterium HLUCCA12]|nr:MAG: flagellar motor switch protein FliG [Rhodobacteraceae bacterium HLUCCA12]
MPDDPLMPALPMADLLTAPDGGLPPLGDMAVPAPGRRAIPSVPPHATSPNGRTIRRLNGRQKAAVLVQLLLSDGTELKLANLPEAMQNALSEEMCTMRLVDRDTLVAVVTEFVETLEQVGLSFHGGVGGALKALDGRLSPTAATRLRQIARARGVVDPWERLADADCETLVTLLERESAEVAAVVVSKLAVKKAAELLGLMPGERARRVAHAVARTQAINPRLVARIGNALATQLDERPPPAFAAPPARRVGDILTNAPTRMREDLLSGLDRDDRAFADGVRKAIFTFANIHERLKPRDVGKVLRDVAQTDLITAFAYAGLQPDTDAARSVAFLLDNMSQRMAATLRDEVDIRGKVRSRDGEEAMTAVVTSVRNLMELGEIELRSDEDEG